MKLHPLLGLLVACLPAFAAARVPLTQLVGDQTALVFHVTDAPALVANWEHSPLARTWNDEQVKRYFAPMRARLHVEEWDERCKAETGYTVRELLALAQGEALFAITDFEFARQKPASEPALLIALELGDNTEAVEKLMQESAEKAEATTTTTEEFAGVRVHLQTETKTDDEGNETPGDTLVWAMVDGTWLLAPQKTIVFEAIDAVQRGGLDNALGKSERFLRAQERTAGAHALGFINLQAIFPVIRDAVVESATPAEGQAPNPFAPNPAALLSALGLDVLDEIYFGIRLEKPATTLSGGLTFRENRGVVKLLAYREGPAPQPDFIPAGWPSVSTGRFSFKDAYAALEEILEAFDPRISGLVQGQIKAFNQQLKIDLKRDLIGSLGEEMVSAYAFRADQPAERVATLDQVDQFIAISLDDATAFTNAVEAVKQIGGPAVEQMLVKREYLGTTLYTFEPKPVEGRPAGKGFTYAITPRHLLVSLGTPAAVERALQGMNGDQPSFWSQPAVRQALADVPPGAATLQYQDMHALIAPLIETVAMIAAANQPAKTAQLVSDDGEGAGEADEGRVLVDPAAKPEAEVLSRYWSHVVGYSLRETDGFYFKSTLAHPE